MSKPFHLVWIFALFFLSMCRIGEAAHPGPSTDDFVLGCANANNLLSKADVVARMPRGIWGFSETCLTKGGVEHFQKALKTQPQASKLRFLPGDFAPPTSTNAAAIGSKHVGVGFCTELPARPLTNDWPDTVWKTARVQTAGFFAGQWIRGGIAYGFAKDCHTPKVLAQTSELLQAISTRIVTQSHGPRFMMGDFNLEVGQIELANFWQEQGFVEAQTYAQFAWGQEPITTCKNCTYKDHVWLSRELLPFVKKVTVDKTWFSDHALVYVTLAPLGPVEPVPVWRKPQPLPWDKVTTPASNRFLENLHPSEASFYRQFWEGVESQVDANLRQQQEPGLSFQQKGRAATTEVYWARNEVPPLRRPRKHDLQLQFTGDHWIHFHWTRQLKRLQSYCHLVKPGSKPASHREVTNLWSAILTALGFARGFRKYWPQRAVQIAGSPSHVPRSPPEYGLGSQLLAAFQADFVAFETNLIKQRRMEARKSRIADPHKIYKDTARPQTLPVQTLITTRTAQVGDVTPEGLASYEGDLSPELPVKGPEGILTIAQHKPGTILVDPDTLMPGDILQQHVPVAHRSAMFEQFAELWTK